MGLPCMNHIGVEWMALVMPITLESDGDAGVTRISLFITKNLPLTGKFFVGFFSVII